VSDTPTSPQLVPEGLVWPLVGRADELERIRLARGAEGCTGVVIGAPAGVGKSRLAREALAEAEKGGALTLWVQATHSAASVPLAAFADVLPPGVRSDDPLELMRASVGALHERADGRPIVLGVDDAQLLDPTSAALVLHLTVTGTVFVVVTVRTGEPCPDAVVSLWKDVGAARIELGALNESETGELAESALGGPVQQQARRWLFDSSLGNVLYVRELLLGALHSKELALVGGLWRLPSSPAPSRSLMELIVSRMDGLAEAERRPIELLSLGEPLRLAEVVQLTGTEPLAAAESRGTVIVQAPSEGGEVRLAHPLYGEVVRASLPVARAREDRLRLAELVQARDDLTDNDALRVARWLLDAGETIPVELLLDAARAANLSGDPELGCELAALALDAGAGFDAALLLARAHTLRKRYEEADVVLEGVEGSMPSEDAAIDYLEQRAVSVLYWGLKRAPEAQGLLARARDWWPEESWKRRLDPMRLHLASLIDGFDGTLAVAREILDEPDLDRAVRRQLEPVYAVSLFYSGRTNEAYELGLRIRPSVPIHDQSERLALGAWSLIGIETGRDWKDLDAWMTQTLSDGIRANDHAAAGIGAITLGGLRHLEGRFEDASRWLAEAEVHLEQQDAFGTLVVARANQVGIAYYTGDSAGAATALERCRAALDGEDPLPNQIPFMARAEAWGARAAGDHMRAQQLLLDAAEEIIDMPVYSAQLNYEAMRAGAPARRVAPSLVLLRERCDARLVAAYAAHTQALGARDGSALLAGAEELADIGAFRYAMEAAADAARTFAADGRQDSARRAAARSHELYALGQGGRPPEIDGVDSAAIGLTPRESQLVELASRGLSNAEIADRLVLSVRTVESHIYRAMQKLGVGDRREL
jgi:DNA-binding NarL/FixJ family response regulator